MRDLLNERRQRFHRLLVQAGALTDEDLIDAIRRLSGARGWVLHRCACLRVLACRHRDGQTNAARRRQLRRTLDL